MASTLPHTLVSFSICPFVQRAVMIFCEKHAAVETRFIDLNDKPTWFLEKSPHGKVPILCMSSGQVLFEAQAIAEFLDETLEGVRLMPDDAVERAIDRAWFSSSGDELIVPTWRMEVASDATSFQSATEALVSRWQKYDEALRGRTWLSGDGSRFGFADVGAAPAAWRCHHFAQAYGHDVLVDLPHVRAWVQRLLERESFARSVPTHWQRDLHAYLEQSRSWMTRSGS